LRAELDNQEKRKRRDHINKKTSWEFPQLVFLFLTLLQLSQLFPSLFSFKDIKTKGVKNNTLGGDTIDKENDWLSRRFCPSNGTYSV
jgi:hypothetical protein